MVIYENEKSRRGSNPKVVTASAYIATRLLQTSGYASFGSTVEACVSRTSKLSTTVASVTVQASPPWPMSGDVAAEIAYCPLRLLRRSRENLTGIKFPKET